MPQIRKSLAREGSILKIAVLAGGYSPEREVSRVSGLSVANALLERGHEVLLLDLAADVGQLPRDPSVLYRRKGVFSALHIPSDPPPQVGGRMIGKGVIEVLSTADVVFLALHGSIGENGHLQALLDCYGIRYTGSGAQGSMLAMDKELSKRLFRAASIPTPEWVRVSDSPLFAAALSARVGYPCVIKPISCGSSVGISMVESEKELQGALTEAGHWGCAVMAERRIVGRELTVAILDGEVLPTVEIRPIGDFYDYTRKYDGSTEELCPAPIPQVIDARAAAFSQRAFEALHLSGYARFDFMLDHTEGLWCLEANTLPGMTPTSLFPRAALGAGISYAELCERIVASALH